MKTKFLSVALGAGMLFAGGSASADSLLDVCVNVKTYHTSMAQAAAEAGAFGCAGQGAQAGQTGFTADVLAGGYQEKVLGTLGAGGGIDFISTTVFSINSMRRDGGTDGILAGVTGLGVGYQLYAVIEAVGSVAGGTSFAAQSATVKVYIDSQLDTNVGLSSIDSTTLSFVGDTLSNDTLLATASALDFGSGTTGSALGQDGFAVQFSDFTLEAAGESYFIAPRPFHMVVYADGSILDGTVTSTLTQVGQLITFNGTGDISFRVPEPASIALAGFGLLAAGFATRRRKQA